MRFWPGNAQHIGARSEQQDSFGFSDPSDRSFIAHGGIAAVVADGMGGLANGSAASCTAVQTFLQAYASKLPEEPVPDALLRSMKSANRAVMDLSLKAGAKDNLGTTLAAVALHEDWLYWVSAGDSRVYFHHDGQLVRLTTDHNYAADLEKQVGKGRITREQALANPERESLTSYLGLEELPHVDRSLRAFPIKPGDCVIICSDGLYRTLTDDEIALSLERNPRKSCDALVERAVAKQNESQDNITVVALQCQADASLLDRLVKPLAAAALVAAAIVGGFFLKGRSVPVISLFAIDQSQIQAGQSAVLRWSVSNGVATITPDIGGTGGEAGTLPVSPSRTTTYTLTVRNGFGSVQRSVELAVAPRPSAGLPVPPPVIVFAANPPQVKAGASVTLSWKVTGGISKVTLNNQDVKPVDSKTISDIQTATTYTLTATGLRGQVVTRTVGVSVSVSPPVITVFTATPVKVQAGQSALLKWAVRNATAIHIEPPPGGAALPLTGSLSVSPAVTTTFKLTASGAASQAGAKVIVVVAPRPKVPVRISFESDKPAIKAGDTATLNWEVTGDVRSVTLDNGIGTVNTVDHRSVTPTSKTVYTLTATDTEGIPSTAVVTIDIAQDPKIELFEAVIDEQVWKLRWRFMGAESGGTRSPLESAIGEVESSSPPDGMRVRSPPPERYALTPEGSGGACTMSATLQSKAAAIQTGMHTENHLSAGPGSIFQTARVCEKGGRPNNEDFCDFLQVGDSILWLVADGLGGHYGGERASRTAVETALESFRGDPGVSAAALERHIAAAQEAILKAQREDPAVAGMRTTLVALISDSRNAIWAHVGDSRLYRFQARGLIAQTEDHSVPQSLAKAGEISPDDIRHHPDRNRLLRSLGEQGPARASIIEGQSSLSDADAFLLCTDGFWENVFEIEMLADLVASASPDEWLDRTTSRLRTRVQGENDNYCALAIFCRPGDASPARSADAPESVRTDGPDANRPAQLENRRSLRLLAPASTVRVLMLESRPSAAAREAAWVWL